MLFQSQFYVLAFLPVTVALYYAAAGSVAARQWVLIAASLFFYGWWDPRFIILVVSQTTATWLLARAYEQTGVRAWLVAGVILNLASLGTFKYLDFLLASFEAATRIALPRAHLILPIGISFFSFQLISYLVDRMRGNAPQYPFRPFALFVLVFPHVIAGPIVRHNELVPQFALDPRRQGMWARPGTDANGERGESDGQDAPGWPGRPRHGRDARDGRLCFHEGPVCRSRAGKDLPYRQQPPGQGLWLGQHRSREPRRHQSGQPADADRDPQEARRLMRIALRIQITAAAPPSIGMMAPVT
jgi:hypothetical protein